jgi:hypothetical protein
MSYSVSQSAPISTVMVTPAQALADLFFRGAHGVALDEVRTGSPELVWRVAQLVGTGLRADAVAHWNAWPREVAWVDHQAALLALARLPGVDQEDLAAAVVEACAWQRIDGKGSPLEPELFAWMMQWAPDSVYAAAADEHSTGYRFLRVGWMRCTWSPEVWSERVHALCEADLASTSCGRFRSRATPSCSAVSWRRARSASSSRRSSCCSPCHSGYRSRAAWWASSCSSC